MAKTNKKVKEEKIYTHEGSPATRTTAENQLRRSLMSCMLWENEFYEDGQKISERIADLVGKVDRNKVALMAIEAREKMHLRHAPLWVVRALAKVSDGTSLVSDTLATVIQRPDELTEFLALYWKDGKAPLSAQVKKGLAKAFTKFSEYSLAKYNRAEAIKLRDVLFLCHAKPKDRDQADLWKRLVDGTMTTPDTWEVELSAGKSKKDVFERLLKEKKLGGLAFLRNLRNMEEAGVDKKLVNASIETVDFSRVLPFRFIAASMAAPKFEGVTEKAMLASMEGKDKMKGKTVLIVDVSGSMYGSSISGRSIMNRAQVASALGILVRELSEDSSIYATAGNDSSCVHQTAVVPARRGFALSDYIYSQCNPLGGGGIFLKQVMDYVLKYEKEADRVIVITDEQDCGGGGEDAPAKANTFGKENYLINVASNKNGISYTGKWTRVDGWSDAVVDFILKNESQVREQ
jgi:hypothetical protein